MRFQNRSNKVAIELRVMQFWSEIILVISNRTHTMRLFDFEIVHVISDQIALTEFNYHYLYNNQINADALVGQSAMGYCASKRASS